MCTMLLQMLSVRKNIHKHIKQHKGKIHTTKLQKYKNSKIDDFNTPVKQCNISHKQKNKMLKIPIFKN